MVLEEGGESQKREKEERREQVSAHGWDSFNARRGGEVITTNGFTDGGSVVRTALQCRDHRQEERITKKKPALHGEFSTFVIFFFFWWRGGGELEARI